MGMGSTLVGQEIDILQVDEVGRIEVYVPASVSVQLDPVPKVGVQAYRLHPVEEMPGIAEIRREPIERDFPVRKH